MNQRKWDGNTGYDLQSHINKSRYCYVELETAAQYVPHQIPLPATRVQNLLDSIEGYVNPDIAARQAAITIEHNGMHANWEAAVAHLLPACHVAVKLRKKRITAHISDVGSTLKKVGPKTGVELHYYAYHEFEALSPEQRDEIITLRREGHEFGPNPGKSVGKDKPGKGPRAIKETTTGIRI